jgi:ADP-ribosylation factor-like protein 2
LKNSKSFKEIIQILELDDIKNRNFKIISSSAITGEGLEEGIEWITNDISERIFLNNNFE